MLFNIIMVFVLLFIMSFMLIAEEQAKKTLEQKADLIITLQWPDNSPHDMDLWLQLPSGKVVGYPYKDGGTAFLERDDLGFNNNYINGKQEVEINSRREVISIRGLVPGKYTVDVILFSRHAKQHPLGSPEPIDKEPIPNVVELLRINPSFQLLKHKELIFTKNKEEQTAFSFTIESDGSVSNIIEEENHFVGEQALGGEFTGHNVDPRSEDRVPTIPFGPPLQGRE